MSADRPTSASGRVELVLGTRDSPFGARIDANFVQGVVLGCAVESARESPLGLAFRRCGQGDVHDMRALRQSLRHVDWVQIFVGALIVLSLGIAGPAYSQESVEDSGDDDFLEDDFLEENEYEDDFLSDDFAEAVEEAEVQEKGVYYWTFEVPLDVLVLRPVGAVDLVIGGMFVTFVTPPLVIGAGFGSLVDAAQGEGWYYDTTNLEFALEQAVFNPSEFLFDRPLGQLVSF